MSKGGFAHESARNETFEWYTPPHVFEAMGLTFDLDPCHPAERLPWIPTRVFYSLPDDGLALPWFGNVWCNPPYGPLTALWLAMLAAHGRGVGLVFSRTDPAWFDELVPTATAVCFIRGRLKFVDRTGKPKPNKKGEISTAGAGSMLIAWGDENAEALDASGLGSLWVPRQRVWAVPALGGVRAE